ncbi:MAG: hypothetical protein EBU56_07875, partial [Burkholderiaceae bacterium]|nr:hypothetical protein [Burkholderiaceae bacterium]
SKASLQNQRHGRAEIHPQWLSESLPANEKGSKKKTLAEGLIALSGAHQGDVGAIHSKMLAH